MSEKIKVCGRPGCESLVTRPGKAYCSRSCSPFGFFGTDKLGRQWQRTVKTHEDQMTSDEMAHHVNVSRTSLLRWFRLGMVPGEKTETGIIFIPAVVIAALKEHGLPRPQGSGARLARRLRDGQGPL